MQIFAFVCALKLCKIYTLSFGVKISQVDVSQKSQRLSASGRQRVKHGSHFAAQPHRQDEERKRVALLRQNEHRADRAAELQSNFVGLRRAECIE